MFLIVVDDNVRFLVMQQVDLTLEAAHLQRFIYNFRKSKDVSFPTPIYPLVHPTVLVEVSRCLQLEPFSWI